MRLRNLYCCSRYPARGTAKALFEFSCEYDIMSAKEKQATRSGICFSCAINEQAVCEAGDEAPNMK